MNRFIIGRLAAIALAAAFAGGCAVAATSQEQDEPQSEGDIVATGEDSLVGGANGAFAVVQHSALTKPANDACASCGPLPEPWQMGPLPEPWTEPKPSSSSSSSSGGGSGGGGTSGGNGKP